MDSLRVAYLLVVAACIASSVNGYTKTGASIGSSFNSAFNNGYQLYNNFRPAPMPFHYPYMHTPSYGPAPLYGKQFPMSSMNFMPTHYPMQPIPYTMPFVPRPVPLKPYDPHQQVINKSVLYSVLFSELLRRTTQG